MFIAKRTDWTNGSKRCESIVSAKAAFWSITLSNWPMCRATSIRKRSNKCSTMLSPPFQYPSFRYPIRHRRTSTMTWTMFPKNRKRDRSKWKNRFWWENSFSIRLQLILLVSRGEMRGTWCDERFNYLFLFSFCNFSYSTGTNTSNCWKHRAKFIDSTMGNRCDCHRRWIAAIRGHFRRCRGECQLIINQINNISLSLSRRHKQ